MRIVYSILKSIVMLIHISLASRRSVYTNSPRPRTQGRNQLAATTNDATLPMRQPLIVRRNYNRARYLIPFIGACIILVSLLIALVMDQASILLGACVMCFAFLYMVGSGGKWILSWRASANLNWRRQAAARGEGHFLPFHILDVEQPTATLSLPVTIRQRLNWRNRTLHIITGSLFLALEIIWGVVYVLARLTPTDSPSSDSLAFGLFEALTVMLIGFFYFMFAFLSRQQIDVTEEALRVRRYGLSHVVPWSEARLFGCLKTNEYELASRRAIVRWALALEDGVNTTTPPFPQYTEQVAALHHLIVARTGLRLADLAKR